MNILDKGKWCSQYLYREHCTYFDGVFVKDLSFLGRKMKDVIIIDNSPTAYLFQPENAIPSISWYDSKDDIQLYEFIPLLKLMS